MNVKITNLCKKRYRPDPEKVIIRILRRIPLMFLSGLAEVRFFDDCPHKHQKRSIICKTNVSTYSIIEVYMDDPLLSGHPFFSIMLLNAMFISAINAHIENYVKHHSGEAEILSYTKPSYDWFYMGVWSPLLFIIKMVNYLVSRSTKLQFFEDHVTDRIIKKSKESTG